MRVYFVSLAGINVLISISITTTAALAELSLARLAMSIHLFFSGRSVALPHVEISARQSRVCYSVYYIFCRLLPLCVIKGVVVWAG